MTSTNNRVIYEQTLETPAPRAAAIQAWPAMAAVMRRDDDTQAQRIGLAIALVCIIGLVVFAICCVIVAQPPPQRIEWERVPVETAPVPRGLTQNQLSLRRERKRMYAALAFERTR